MKYSVVWPPQLLERLADQFMLADARGQGQAFTDAVNRIDRLLESKPFDRGESRSGSLRVLIESPVSVMFRVVQSRQMVVIARVRYAPWRSPPG